LPRLKQVYCTGIQILVSLDDRGACRRVAASVTRTNSNPARARRKSRALSGPSSIGAITVRTFDRRQESNRVLRVPRKLVALQRPPFDSCREPKCNLISFSRSRALIYGQREARDLISLSHSNNFSVFRSLWLSDRKNTYYLAATGPVQCCALPICARSDRRDQISAVQVLYTRKYDLPVRLNPSCSSIVSCWVHLYQLNNDTSAVVTVSI
jgi:hypothetical protein